MRRIRYSASAESDLLDAWLYIAEDSVAAADRLLDQIETEAQHPAAAAGNGPYTR